MKNDRTVRSESGKPIIDSLTLTSYCFAEGTPILMSDGTYKPIEQINVGDEVMAFEGLGELQSCKVTQTFIKYGQEVIQLGDIYVTSGHSFLQPDGSFKPLAYIEENGFLIGVTGKLIPHPGIKPVAGKHTVYNFAVEGLHTYVAGDYRVHNESLSLYRPVTTAGIIGAAVGGQIGGYFADNTFAGQLLARSAGSTITGWIGDAIVYEVLSQESLSAFALPYRFSTTLISNAISLGASQFSEYLFDIWNLDDPLEQLLVSTIVSSVASYGTTLAVDSVSTALLGNTLTAVKYFGSDPITYSINASDNPVVLGADLSLSNFGSQVITSLANALGAYAGQQISKNLFDLSFETQVGGQLGATLGGFIAGPIGAAIGNIYGSFVGYLTEEIPILGYALGGWVIELIEVFADKDYPRAAYVVQVENGEFVSKFAYVQDDGNIQVAQQMADVAQNLLDFWASNIGGILLRSDEIFYGHWANEDGNQMVYQLADDAPGGSSFRRRVGFGDDGKAAVEAGVVVQLTTTEIEGGDRYIKRFLSVFSDPRSNLDALNRNFQIAKEYGIYRDNPALYLELINDLKTNAITRADAAILDLQNHPWDAYTPPERNPVIVKDIAEGILPNAVTLSIEGDNLLINNGTFIETIYQWTKTQGEHKVQKLSRPG